MFNFKSEYIKCYKDKSRIYFIENYFSTYNAMERKEVPFKLFPRQKVYLKTAEKYDNIIASKPRQTGITTLTAAWVAAQCVFIPKGSPEIILCIANKLEQATELSNKIVFFLEQVPRWMWGSDYYSNDPTSEKNKKTIFVKKNKAYVELFNGCKIYARASSANAARGISSVSCLIVDECAFIDEGMATYTSAVAAMSAVEHAKCFLVSTPNGKDQLYYGIYSKALRGENNFHAVEFRWFQDPRYNRSLRWYKKNKDNGNIDWEIDSVIDKKGNVVYDEERWAMLEREGWTPTSPWFEKQCKTMNNNSQKIAQELLVSFLGSSDNVVPVEVIEEHTRKNVIKITEDWSLRDSFVKETWIWKDPNPEHRYIAACDPSGGSGEDFTAIQIIDADAIDEKGMPFFEQVLEYNGKLNGEEIGQLLDKYGRIYNDALVVVDCLGGYGDAVVLTLLNLGYPNLYYDETESLKTYTNDYARKLFKKKDDEKLPGFRSNGLRIQMISNFVEMLKNNTFRIRSERVITELDTWVFKNGRPDHMSNAHDDLLTCLSMGLFVLQFYMLRSDKLKKKDGAIVSSWAVNNSNQQTFNQKYLNKELNISNTRELAKKFDNMIFTDYREQSKDTFLKACVMLGGYKTKKN